MRRFAPRASIALLASLIGAGAASCNLADPFEGYRDSTKNLIAASGLGASDLTPAGYQSSGVWTWAWGGASDADNFDYMTLAPVGLVGDGGAAVPSGLDPASTAYRLELVNLMPNGDFEGAVGGEWAKDNRNDAASSTAFAAIDTGSLPINGRSLYLSVEGNISHNVRFNLGALADAAGSSDLHTYDWLSLVNSGAAFKYKQADFTYQSPTDPNAAVDMTNAIDPTPNLASIVSGRSILSFKVRFTDPLLGSDQKALFFGSPAPSSLVLDDVRVLRSDIENRLRLLLKPPDTSPALVRGYYEFSVWARKPADSRFATETGTADPYAARSLTVRMLQLSPSLSSAEHSYPLDGTPDSADWGGAIYDASSGWVKLVLRLAEGGNFFFDPYSAEAVLELSLAPYDSAQAEPGAVEIAQPDLRFYLNGY